MEHQVVIFGSGLAGLTAASCRDPPGSHPTDEALPIDLSHTSVECSILQEG